MDPNTTYTKTSRGLRALIKKLPRDAGLVLSEIDGNLTAEEILSNLSSLNKSGFEDAITWLIEGGFIKPFIKDPFSDTVWDDAASHNAVQVDEIGLDQFTVSEKPPASATKMEQPKKQVKPKLNDEESAKIKALEQADNEAHERAEAALKAKLDAENESITTKKKNALDEEIELKALAKAEEEAREKAEIEARVLMEAEAKENAKKEAAAKKKAEERAAAEKKEIEAEEKARLEALAEAEEEAREKAEIEAKALMEAEAKENAKKEAAAKKKAEERAAAEKKEIEAEERARLEALAKAEEGAREKAEIEAKALMEAEAKENAKKEAAAKKKAEAEQKSKEKSEAKEKAKLEAVARKEEKIKVKAEKKAEAKVAAEKKSLEKTAAKERARLEQLREDEHLDGHHSEKRTSNKVNLVTLTKKWLTNIAKSIKPLSIYAVAVLVLLIIATQFINFHIWIKPIERVAENNIQDNVSIKSIRVSFFPSPHLLLEGLTIADSTTITAEKVRVYPSLSSLKEKLVNSLEPPYEIESINIENFKIAQKDLSRVASWNGASSRDQQLKINKISLKNISIHLNNMELPNFNGDILLDAAGLLKKATISTENKNLTAVINHNNNSYLIDIDAVRWRAPLSPYPIFTKLNAKATVNNDVLAFSNITGTLYNGALNANVDIDLASEALASKGEFKLSNFFIADMAEELKLNTAIDGKLNANGKFSFKINKPLNNIFDAQLTSAFSIKSGYLKTIDLAEAMRSGNLSGYTKFTDLSGSASLSNKTYLFTGLLLRDNQLSARGRVELSPEQYVSSTIASTIAVKNNPIRSRLAISGPLTALKIKR